MLSTLHVAAFESVRQRLDPERLQRVLTASVEAVPAAQASALHWDFLRPAETVDQALGDEATGDMRRALIATWLLEIVPRVEAEALPPEVTALYPHWLDKWAAFLSAGNGDYDPDLWAKDVRMALVLSVPTSRTLLIDLSSPVGPGEVVRHGLDGHGWRPVLTYFRIQGWRKRWLQTHVDVRDRSDFTPDGWDRNWVVSAALCRSRPKAAGVMGSSWFFDPPLETISPDLAFLRLTPKTGGAMFVHQGSGPLYSERAGKASSKRRNMIRKGEYLPRSWLLYWPRQRLIAFVDRNRAAHSVSGQKKA